MGRRVTTEIFIARSIKTHGDTYDYSMAEYAGDRKKLTIICRLHGRFEQQANNHMNGSGCNECGRLRTIESQSVLARERRALFNVETVTIDGKMNVVLNDGDSCWVDSEDYEMVNSFNWKKMKGANTFYAVTVVGGKKLLLHRFLMDVTDSHDFIDHIDGDGLNCSRGNLRKCTNSQNQMNRSKLVGTSSRFKGVCWDKKNCKWKSSLSKEGKTYNLGRHNSEEEAAKVYDQMALEVFGEFAKLNFLV